MPNILVKIPRGSFSVDARKALARLMSDAAATAEKIPREPQMRALTWVLIEEIDPGMWTCGGEDVSEQLLTCLAVALVPAGVLDEASRALYVQLMHDAFKKSLPPEESRRLASSVILHDVIDGTWGGSGSIWDLRKLSKAAGYEHLQHLNTSTELTS